MVTSDSIRQTNEQKQRRLNEILQIQNLQNQNGTGQANQKTYTLQTLSQLLLELPIP